MFCDLLYDGVDTRRMVQGLISNGICRDLLEMVSGIRLVRIQEVISG
jgi:hypothetical protein